MRYRLLLVAGISVLALGTGLMVWMQLSAPTTSHAAIQMELSEDALPSDLKVEAMIESVQDTANRGIRTKAVKPLSLTPVLPAN